jgi:hypothetical protein
MEAKKDNVLRFPGKKAEPAPVAPPQSPRPENGTPAAKGLMRIAAMVVISLVANRWLGQSSGSVEIASTGGRAVASVSDHAIVPEERDSEWEKFMANEISSGSRGPASVRMGQRPSLEDRLRFGVLKSQYFLDLTDGKLNEIRWTESQEDTAVYVTDRARFLVDYRDIMPMKFSVAVPEQRQEISGEIFETFALVGSDQIKVGEARFGLDRYGRLMSLVLSGSTSVQ